MPSRIRYTTFFIILFVLCFSKASAQSIKKQFNNGLDALYNENFKKAYSVFESINQSKPGYRDLTYFYSLSASLSGVDPESNKEIFSSFEDQTDKYPFFYYWLGRIETATYDNDKATKAFESFLKTPGYKNPVLVKETKTRLKELKSSSELLTTQRPFAIKNFSSLNTSSDDISANLSKGSILYISANMGKITSLTDSEKIIELGEDFDEIQIIKNNIVIRKGNRLFIGDIEEEQIKNITPLGLEVTGELYSFYFSESLDLAYLALNTKRSGADIFYSEKAANGTWGLPAPLSESVNSVFNETTPYFDETNQSLYFSSDRPNQIGKYDIYSSERSKSGWAKANNLGAPINSPDDELFFKGSQESLSTFSSSRIGGQGNLDIYVSKPIKTIKLKGKIIHKVSQKIIENGELLISSIGAFAESKEATITSGVFEIEIDPFEEYKILIKNNNRELLSINYSVPDVDKKKSTTNKTFYIKEGIVLVEGNLSTETNQTAQNVTDYKKPANTNIVTPNKGEIQRAPIVSVDASGYLKRSKAITANIYFEFDSYSIQDSQLTTLKQLTELMKNQKNIKIEIAGHTDIVGENQTNQRMSELRAEQVKKWLTRNDIAGSRLATTGYSEKIPMASNNFENEGKEFNRRVEFLIIE